MRNFTKALILATVSMVSVAASAQRVTTDIDAIEVRERRQEAVAQRAEQRNQQVQGQVQQPPPQQQRRAFQPRTPRDFDNAPSQDGVEVRRDRGGFDRRLDRQPPGNVEVRRDAPSRDGAEVRRDRGGFDRRPDRQPQENVEVRRDDRRFGNRSDAVVIGNGQQTQVVPTPQADGRRFRGRRFDQSDGQRFGRNEEYRSDRDENRRLNRDDLRRRGEVVQGNNWQRNNDGRWQRRDNRYYGNRDNRDYRDYGHSGGYRDFRWNNDWRRDNRYDWKSYRSSNRNFYRQPRYYDPFGSRYGYKRFSIGVVIGSGYYSDRYWISDPYAYRLPYADGPYRWVRYYDDVLLIDIRNGYVVDMIYDFFW